MPLPLVLLHEDHVPVEPVRVVLAPVEALEDLNKKEEVQLIV